MTGPVTPLPPAPNRSDPANFSDMADAMMAAFEQFVTEINAAFAAYGVNKWVSGTTYSGTNGDLVWSPTSFRVYRRRTNGAGTTDPVSDSTNWQDIYQVFSSIVADTGAADAYTGTISPAVTVYYSGLQVVLTAANTNTGASTINFNGVGAVALRNKAGQALSARDIVAGFNYLLQYNSGVFIVLGTVNSEIDARIALKYAPVRQTVLSGPVDSNGLAAFGGATGGTAVTASGTLVATAANGILDRVGSIVNPSWTGLSTNGTLYLYLSINTDGTCSTGIGTAPTYQPGGTYSTTGGAHTFNIQEMMMKVGNGSGADQVYQVCVGEVTVSGNVVTAITWYALMGRYRGAWTATLPGTATKVSANHNLGIIPDLRRFVARCNSADQNYASGEVITPCVNSGSGSDQLNIPATYKSMSITGGSAGTGWGANDNTSGGGANLTAAKWDYQFQADRGW